jgi:DNA-directed RNA polymerase subunit beta'
MVNTLENKLVFHNQVINKKKLQGLMYLTFHNFGVIRSSVIADRLKNLTFHYATVSGISLSVEDLRVPYSKRRLIGLTTDEVSVAEQNYNNGNVTVVERYQNVIDIWNNANNTLKDEVLTYFRESDPFNPLYIMAFSGARGNISQVRQLVGMRGLMADPQGQIIDLPIKSNFREGLKITEYIISSYGARKGLVDTALRTADSGYLTRRLVDVAQDIIVRDDDCITYSSLTLDDLFGKYKTEVSPENRLVGRLLAKPLVIKEKGLTFPVNSEIDTELAKTIVKYFLNSSNLEAVEVRSPLTCDALRSVCRKCYGWHLSYSKLIDLGEAVGILAAQSIGEPGTQLTMRTFHTGGVFSGDMTNQIRAPFAGRVKYDLRSKTAMTRTVHGEKGFNLGEGITVFIESNKGSICSINLPAGALLFVNSKKYVYENQVIAEIKKDDNVILEEDQRDIYTEVSGEVFLQNIKLEENIDNEGAAKKVSKTAGLIWVLSGDRYILPNTFNLTITVGQKFMANQPIASHLLQAKSSGIVKFTGNAQNREINLIESSAIIENGFVKYRTSEESPDTFELLTPDGNKVFNLTVANGDMLTHGQTLASLNEIDYQTETGGIIYYSIDVATNKKKRNTKQLFKGTLYWVPEETHKYDPKKITVKEGSFINKGSAIDPNTISNIDGFIFFGQEGSELIIKPGELYEINKAELNYGSQENRFVQAGELLLNNVFVQKLSYLEHCSIKGKNYILLRPVQIFKVPQDKGFDINYRFFPTLDKRSIAFRTVKRFFYKDGERVKMANGGVNLLKTFLVLDIRNTYKSLKIKVEFIEGKSSEGQKLKISLYDNILANVNLSENEFLKSLVHNNQYVTPNTVVAKIETLLPLGGTLTALNKNNSTELLILRENHIKNCFVTPENKPWYVKKGDLIRVGTFLREGLKSKYAGQIYEIGPNYLKIRKGRPYLISDGTVLRAGNKSLVDRSDLLATLVYNKYKTVDIVQGLPKVEEILEARKIKNGCLLSPHEGKAYFTNSRVEILKSPGEKSVIHLDKATKVNFVNGQYVEFLDALTDGPISPHDKLETLFNYYEAELPAHEACKKSFKYMQLFLVNEVQRTYLSQGVEIADKHIEVIVKQMTSKVRITEGGDTTLLPGEILDISQMELITKATIAAGNNPPLYRPMLLGITKASLNSDSFISAASFQETTRVLTEAAIEGKKDWLNGLKENVIIGRLIPAGTGFNCFDNFNKLGKRESLNKAIKGFNEEGLKSYILKSRTT